MLLMKSNYCNRHRIAAIANKIYAKEGDIRFIKIEIILHIVAKLITLYIMILYFYIEIEIEINEKNKNI